ncbi:unnamed protein product [Amoebophrya sp. A120]|nr:unnamed protein product [Amoebophrya sp. A120]|eukprot:GSA120T00000746001.1
MQGTTGRSSSSTSTARPAPSPNLQRPSLIFNIDAEKHQAARASASARSSKATISPKSDGSGSTIKPDLLGGYGGEEHQAAALANVSNLLHQAVDVEHVEITERDFDHAHIVQDSVFARLGRHVCDRIVVSGFPKQLRYYNRGSAYFPSDKAHDINGHYLYDNVLGLYRKENVATGSTIMAGGSGDNVRDAQESAGKTKPFKDHEQRIQPRSFSSRVSESRGGVGGGGTMDPAQGIMMSQLSAGRGDEEDPDSHLYLQWVSDHLGRWVVHEILPGTAFDATTGHFNWDEVSEHDDRVLAVIPDPHFLCFHETPRQIVQEAFFWNGRADVRNKQGSFMKKHVHLRFCGNHIDAICVQGSHKVRQSYVGGAREQASRLYLPIEQCGWNQLVRSAKKEVDVVGKSSSPTAAADKEDDPVTSDRYRELSHQGAKEFVDQKKIHLHSARKGKNGREDVGTENNNNAASGRSSTRAPRSPEDADDLGVTLDDNLTDLDRFSADLGTHSFEICNLKYMVEKEKGKQANRNSGPGTAPGSAKSPEASTSSSSKRKSKESATAGESSTKSGKINPTATTTDHVDDYNLVLLETRKNLPATVPFTLREIVDRNREFVLQNLEEFNMLGAVVTVNHRQEPLLRRMVECSREKEDVEEAIANEEERTAEEQDARVNTTTADGPRKPPPPLAAKPSAPGAQMNKIADGEDLQAPEEKSRMSNSQNHSSLLQQLFAHNLVRSVSLGPTLWSFPYISLVGAPACDFHCNGVYEKLHPLQDKEEQQGILHVYRRSWVNVHGDVHERFLLVRMDTKKTVLHWRLQKHYKLLEGGEVDFDDDGIDDGSRNKGSSGTAVSRRRSSRRNSGSASFSPARRSRSSAQEEQEQKRYTERGEVLFHATTPQELELHGRLGLLQLQGAWNNINMALLGEVNKTSSPTAAHQHQTILLHFGHEVHEDMLVSSEDDDSEDSSTEELELGYKQPQRRKSSSELKQEVLKDLKTVNVGDRSSFSSSQHVDHEGSTSRSGANAMNKTNSKPNYTSSTQSAGAAPSSRRILSRLDSEAMGNCALKLVTSLPGGEWCNGVYTRIDNVLLPSDSSNRSHDFVLDAHAREIVMQKRQEVQTNHEKDPELHKSESCLLFVRTHVEVDGFMHPILNHQAPIEMVGEQQNHFPDDVKHLHQPSQADDPAPGGEMNLDYAAQEDLAYKKSQVESAKSDIFFLHYNPNTFGGSWVVSWKEHPPPLKENQKSSGVANKARKTSSSPEKSSPSTKEDDLVPDNYYHKPVRGGSPTNRTKIKLKLSKAAAEQVKGKSENPGAVDAIDDTAAGAVDHSASDIIGVIPDPFRYHWKDRSYEGDSEYAGHHFSWGHFQNTEFDLCLGMFLDDNYAWQSRVTELITLQPFIA